MRKSPSCCKAGAGAGGAAARGRFLVVFPNLLHLDHGRKQLADVVSQLGMAVDVLLERRPLAGPVPRGELVGGPSQQNVVGGVVACRDLWTPVSPEKKAAATMSPHRRPAQRIQPLVQLAPCVAVQHLNDTVGIKFHPADHLCPEFDSLPVALDRSGQFP